MQCNLVSKTKNMLLLFENQLFWLWLIIQLKSAALYSAGMTFTLYFIVHFTQSIHSDVQNVFALSYGLFVIHTSGTFGVDKQYYYIATNAYIHIYIYIYICPFDIQCSHSLSTTFKNLLCTAWNILYTVLDMSCGLCFSALCPKRIEVVCCVILAIKKISVSICF